LPEIDAKGSITSAEFNERFVKPRVPVLVRNAAMPRDVAWFLEQKCLAHAPITNSDEDVPAEKFWGFYKKNVDPSYSGSQKVNSTKYFTWLKENYKTVLRKNRLDQLG
jgi:hypothetical protein